VDIVHQDLDLRESFNIDYQVFEFLGLEVLEHVLELLVLSIILQGDG